MTVNYDYLIPFKTSESDKSDFSSRNSFYPVFPEEIQKLEECIETSLPNELKDFYNQIGYGFLDTPKNAPEDYVFYDANRIDSPLTIVQILEEGQESGLIDQDTYESLEPGDIPVFECGDSSRFMIMKTRSNNPNAVWFQGSIKVEDSFERFIYNLYHDAPDYYARNW